MNVQSANLEYSWGNLYEFQSANPTIGFEPEQNSSKRKEFICFSYSSKGTKDFYVPPISFSSQVGWYDLYSFSTYLQFYFKIEK